MEGEEHVMLVCQLGGEEDFHLENKTHDDTMTRTHDDTNTRWHEHTMPRTHDDTNTPWKEHTMNMITQQVFPAL